MKNFKKILSIVLCLAMMLSSVALVSAEESNITEYTQGAEGTRGAKVGSVNKDTSLAFRVSEDTGAVMNLAVSLLYSAGDWIECTVIAPEAKDYIFEVRAQTIDASDAPTPLTGGLADISVNGTTVNSNVAIKHVANPDTAAYSDCGFVSLNAGSNTIRFTLAKLPEGAKNVSFTHFRLVEVEENINTYINGEVNSGVNCGARIGKENGYIASATGVNIATNYSLFTAVGGWVEGTIVTKEAGDYMLGLRSQTEFLTGGEVDITVNGELVCDNLAIKHVGDFVNYVDCGMISLKSGKNTIRLTLATMPEGITEGVTCTFFRLAEVVENIDTYINGESGTRGARIGTENGYTHGDNVDMASNYSTLTAVGAWVEGTIVTKEAKDYTLGLRSQTQFILNGLVDITVNGELVCDDLAIRHVSDFVNYVDCGVISLKPGKNTIRLTLVKMPEDETGVATGVDLHFFRLAELKENLGTLPAEFVMGSNNTDLAYTTEASVVVNSAWTTFYNNTWIDYEVSTLNSGDYLFAIKGEAQGAVVNVKVNGVYAYENVTISAPNGYTTFGEISLNAGKNHVIFEVVSVPGADVSFSHIKFSEKVENSVILSNGTANASVTYDEAQTGLAIIALYDVNNTLIGYNTLSVSAQDTFEITANYNGAVNSVRVFIWGDLDACQPLAAEKILTIQ